MKFVLFLALGLAGCSNLNVSWTATASYNMVTETQSGIRHIPQELRAEPTPPALPKGTGI